MKNVKSFRNHERGSTLVYSLLLVGAISALTLAATKGVTSDMATARNYKEGTRAFLAAESGIVHSKRTLERYGVIRFEDVLTDWARIFGTSSIAVPNDAAVSYAVVPMADPADPSVLVLTSVGRAGSGARRTISGRLGLGAVFSGGAIYLPGDEVDTTFHGNAFLVDGFDHNLNGTLSGESVPGVGTAIEETAATVSDSLSNVQTDNVIGAGGMPSVYMSDGPSEDRLQNEIVPNLLTKPGVVRDPSLSGNDTFGTLLAPQITYFSGDARITGTVSGAGIMIVERGLLITGDVYFTGLIIVRGTTEITSVLGNATILGALWTTDLQLTVAGSASVTYSKQALAVADVSASSDALPRQLTLLAWAEE